MRLRTAVSTVGGGLALVLVLVLSPGGCTAPASRLDVEGSVHEAELVAWAVGRFEAAGLDLPEVRISFHHDRSACGGGSGRVTASDVDQVDVCVRYRRTDRVYRRVLLHELAHVWMHEHVDAAGQEAFLVARGLDEWGPPAPWYLQGREHAAEVIAWGLEETDLGCHTVEPNDRTSLEEGFRLLTGVEPICVDPGPSHAPLSAPPARRIHSLHGLRP